MRVVHLSLAWLFITAAAGYDSYFAWKYREALTVWELNPLACWAAAAFGLHAVFGFKAFTLAFAGGLAFFCNSRRRRLALWITGTIGCAYVLLSATYLVEQMQPPPPVVNASPGVVMINTPEPASLGVMPAQPSRISP
jgi:hypothetical protein